MPDANATISKDRAKRLWIHAQRLDVDAPFGAGAAATAAAVAHLGYVQIDTIHVVERSHHHILWSRIPRYRRADLHHAQSIDKTVFEYWTHALAYVSTADFRYFVGAMKSAPTAAPATLFARVAPADIRKIVRRIAREGALSIRDIDDDVLVEKDHAWASRKPSKRALQRAFFAGLITVSERHGMVKTYDLVLRHFGWTKLPRAATEKETTAYVVDRAIRAQAIVSVDSICHLDAKRKPAVHALLAARESAGELAPVRVRGAEKIAHWAPPELLARPPRRDVATTHLLSPFDPLIIQRKRVLHFFDHAHRFEAYVPKEKRLFGYFALPALVDDRIVALVDLKTDRQAKALLVQKWTWLAGGKSAENARRIDEALHRFERFQLG